MTIGRYSARAKAGTMGRMDNRYPSPTTYAGGGYGAGGQPPAAYPSTGYGDYPSFAAQADATLPGGFPPGGFPPGVYPPGMYSPGALPPGMYPPGYNPWLGTFAGPRYASVWLRIAAYFIDSLVLGVVNVVAYLTVIVATTTSDQAGAPTVPPTAMLAAIVLILVLDGVYFVAQEGSSGQTLGKRVLGIRVVKADGGEMGADAALVRYLFLLLTGIGLGGLVTILTIALSDTKQRMGDRVAGTIVVKAG